MQPRKLVLLLVAVMLTGVGVSLMPTVAAQQNTVVSIAMTPPTDAVKPLQGALNFPGTTTITVDQTGQTNVVGVTITYTVSSAPAWAQVVVSPATDIAALPQPGASPSATITRTFTVSVTASDQAPAFQPGPIEITANVQVSSPGGKTGSAKGVVPVAAAFFSIIDIQLAEAIKVERPQTPVAFPLKISNFGNANTKVNFEISDKTENLNTPVPIPVVLQSKQAGGNLISAEVPLTVQTPYKNGYMNEVGVVNYKITSSYALDPKLKGDETRVSVVITTKGFYVPGVEIPLLLGLIGGMALVLRRRA